MLGIITERHDNTKQLQDEERKEDALETVQNDKEVKFAVDLEDVLSIDNIINKENVTK